MKKCVKISIGGPIGAGKSTLLRKIVSELSGEWVKIEEPTEKFKHYLELTYKNDETAKRHNLSCQIKIFCERTKRTREVGKNNPNKNKIQERFLGDDIIFWKTQVALGNVNELDDETYMGINTLWQELLDLDDMVPDLLIYLRPDDEECWSRIKERGRIEESKMTMRYTQELNKQHDLVYKTEDGLFLLPNGKKIPIVYYESNANFRDDRIEIGKLISLVEESIDKLKN